MTVYLLVYRCHDGSLFIEKVCKTEAGARREKKRVTPEYLQGTGELQVLAKEVEG